MQGELPASLSRRALVLAAVLAGCSASGPAAVPEGCNPLIGDDCLTPFPSAFIEVPDATTATGLRISLPANALPAPRGGMPLDSTRLDLHDGVSPATPFVVYFARGVNAAQLPTLDQLAQSATAASTVQILNVATGERVPVFAELDANAGEGARQALLIRPMSRLLPATRYVIALVGLQDADGKPLVARGFAALRDGTELTNPLAAVKASYEQLFAALEGAGVTRSSLTLAWDVTTASDADVTGHLVAMRDQALAMVDSLSWTITSNTETTSDPDRLREIIGTFEVPWFLTDATAQATLSADAGGNPVLNGLGSASFVVDIPACAKTATGPLPVYVFGHGIFGTAANELESPYEKQVGNFLCMVAVGTDWIGLSRDDLPTVINDVLPDFSHFNIVTDRLQQAHVNAQVLTRLFLRHLKNDPALQVNGHPVTNGSQIYYYGISNGGIQGGTYMALSEDVTRGALSVAGGEWTLMFQRSTGFLPLSTVLDAEYRDLLDQQILIALLQPDFDFSDPVGFAPHLLASPLPNAPVKHVLVQEGIHDTTVPNVATRVLVRAVGMPGIDLVQQVYGIPVAAAPQPSAYTQWDIMATLVPPDTNQPASTDNPVHESVRRLSLVEAQLQAFFTPDGQVQQTCTGPCVCNFAGGTCDFPPGVN
jgi:hypothetical protein